MNFQYLDEVYGFHKSWDFARFLPDVASTSATAFPLVLGIALLLSLCICTVIINHERELPQARRALEALLSVLCPTRSLWPPYYARLAKQCGVFDSRQITIPISRLIEDVSSGTVELRDANNDLQDLLQDRICVDGWQIRVGVDWSLKRRISKWRGTRHGASGRLMSHIDDEGLHEKRVIARGTSQVPGECTQTCRIAAKNNASSYNLDNATNSRDSTASTSNLYDLDRVCEKDLQQACRSVSLSLRTGSSATIAFSVRNSTASYKICAVPFLPRLHGGSPEHRTSIPMTLTLSRVIQALDAARREVNGPAIHLNVAQNITESAIFNIRKIRERMEWDSKFRTPAIKNFGPDGWREELLMLDWEAAILKAGMVSRWKIVITKK